MAGKRGRFNPDKVSRDNPLHDLQPLAPNSGNFRDPLANKRGRKPGDHPWKGTPDRWISQTFRVLIADLNAVLNEAGRDGWDYEIACVRSDAFNPRGDASEVVVVFKKHFFKRETKP